MKVGMTLQLTSFDDKPDLETYQDELSLMEMAEGLGFDSVWALDHHFTGYVMSPNPTELLAYVAGRTKKMQLGTAVIVLPWHDPVEVAEKIALLDVVSNGRTIFGFGRGPRALYRERDDRAQGADESQLLVGRQTLPDSRDSDPPASRVTPGRPLL